MLQIELATSVWSMKGGGVPPCNFCQEHEKEKERKLKVARTRRREAGIYGTQFESIYRKNENFTNNPDLK